MKRFLNWLTMSDLQKSHQMNDTHTAIATYRSRLDVKVDISGDIDYVLGVLPIIVKQLQAADGRLTDAT